MRTIRCTTGEEAIVDDWNFDYLSQWTWYVQNGYVRRTIYETRTQKSTPVFLHKEILCLAGYTDFETVDHVNRNSLDNQEGNLRTATHCQNSQNRGLLCTNKSGYTGVHWVQRVQKGKWVSHVESDGKKRHLGYFEHLLDAIKARDVGVLYFHDADFATLNLERWHYPPGHPDTWPTGDFSGIIHRCRR
jgi:hypothetical protein